MPMYSSYSHRSQNRLLVGCITLVVGGSLMCCFLLALFNVGFPMLEQWQPSTFPIIVLVIGAGMLFLLAIASLIVLLKYLRKKS